VSNPEVAVGQGYAESKWIAERILDAAAERTSLRPVVVRLGQVCGEGNGTWNEKEWFPSLVKSGLTLNCLPRLDGVSGIMMLITPTALSLIGRLDCLLDYSTRCCRSNARDGAYRSHTRRTHLPRCSPPWRVVQRPRWFGRIVAQRSTCPLPRMAFKALRGAQGPVRFEKVTSGQPRIADIQSLRNCTHRTRVGTYRLRALRYVACGTRIKSAGRRRQATRRRQCTEMAGCLELERLPPTETEEGRSPYVETDPGVNTVGGDRRAGDSPPSGVFDRSASFEGATAVYMVSMFECGFLVTSPTTECLFRFFPASIFMHLDLQRNVGCYGIPNND